MAETTGQIKTTTVDQLPEETNTTGFWLFGYNQNREIGKRSVKFLFTKIQNLFGIENAMGTSTTVAPSQRAVAAELYNISTMLANNLKFASGVNQLNNSNKMKVGYTNTPESIKMEMVDSALKVTIVGGPTAGYFNTIINGAASPLKDIYAGQEITYSARIKLLNGVIYPIFYIYTNLGYLPLVPIENSEDAQGFKLCSATIKATTTKINAFATPSMRLGGVDSSILIKEFKIEVGNSPTPHSLSIADVLNYPAVPII